MDRGPVTDGDARAFIASVVLARQNEAETQRKKVKVTIPRSDPLDFHDPLDFQEHAGETGKEIQ